MLAPARAGDHVFVLQHEDRRFGPGDAERYLPSSLLLVLPGSVSPHDGNLVAVLDGRGVVVSGTRTTRPLDHSPRDRAVRIRGEVATVSDAQSVTTGRTIRRVTWAVQDGGHYIQWMVWDLAKHRPLDDLVRIVDALAES